MREYGREIIFLQKQNESICVEQKVYAINKVLQNIENIKTICSVVEVANLNTYEIIKKAQTIKKLLLKNWHQPFVFCIYKN